MRRKATVPLRISSQYPSGSRAPGNLHPSPTIAISKRPPKEPCSLVYGALMLHVKLRSASSSRPFSRGGGHVGLYGRRMRVLLTGGSGFLGSFVAEQLA